MTWRLWALTGVVVGVTACMQNGAEPVPVPAVKEATAKTGSKAGVYGPGGEKDCLKCQAGRVSCLAGCSNGRCESSCEMTFKKCWENERCENLDPECEDCLDAEAKCVSMCSDDDGVSKEDDDAAENVDCVNACAQTQKLCWQDEDCDGPYVETTPICNYLDRGVVDFKQETTDAYSVSPPGIKSLADIGMLEFGLDVPEDNCVKEPSHSIPCADKDIRTDWTIDRVVFGVQGIPLFEAEKAPDEQHLKLLEGGIAEGGIHGWTKADIRNNPLWGFSENEAEGLFTAIPAPQDGELPAQGDFVALVRDRSLHAEDLAAVFEGSVGRALASAIKAKNCSSKYCDNTASPSASWRGTFTDRNPDCDFGNCASQSARQPSPWVESRRQPGTGGELSQGRIEVSMDMEIVVGIPDPTDCPYGDPLCDAPFGMTPKWLANADIRIVLEPVCLPSSGGQFAIRMALTDFSMHVEDVFAGLDKIKEAIENQFNANGTVDAQLRQTLASLTLVDGLEICPSPVVAPVDADGTLHLPAPPTSPNLRKAEPARFVRWARLTAEPGAQRKVLTERYGEDVATLSIASDYNDKATYDILGLDQASTKQSFRRLQASLEAICVLTAADDDKQFCGDDLDLDDVELPPPSIEPGVSPFDCAVGAPDGDPDCEALAQIKAFMLQPAVYEHCIKPNLPAVGLPDGGVTPDAGTIPPDQAMPQLWGVIETMQTACSDNLPSILTLVPVGAIDLEVKTGRTATTNTFPFVRFQETTEVSASDLDEYKCRHRPMYTPVADPPSYDECATSEDDANGFGMPGCKCRDLDVLNTTGILLEAGRPDGEGSYLEHGLEGSGQYCFDQADADYVCGAIERPGRKFPQCMQCGVDTNIGCACDATSDCQGVEENLRCMGAPDEGWVGGEPGRCLPDPGTPNGPDLLVDVRWFCLENCNGTDGAGVTTTAGGCFFNQTNAGKVDHGTCIDALSGCGDYPPGGCEFDETANQGGVPHSCVYETNICEQQCFQQADCVDRGFPVDFLCDAEFNGTGHCVPFECAGATVADPEYCNLYR